MAVLGRILLVFLFGTLVLGPSHSYADTDVSVTGSAGGHGENGSDVPLLNAASGSGDIVILNQSAIGGAGGYGDYLLPAGKGGYAGSLLSGLSLGFYATTYNVSATGGRGGDYDTYDSTGEGGRGGEAEAGLSLLGPGDLTGSATAIGGRGGDSTGTSGGAGGAASLGTVYGESTTGGTVNITGAATGGRGGDSNNLSFTHRWRRRRLHQPGKHGGRADLRRSEPDAGPLQAGGAAEARDTRSSRKAPMAAAPKAGSARQKKPILYRSPVRPRAARAATKTSAILAAGRVARPRPPLTARIPGLPWLKRRPEAAAAALQKPLVTGGKVEQRRPRSGQTARPETPLPRPAPTAAVAAGGAAARSSTGRRRRRRGNNSRGLPRGVGDVSVEASALGGGGQLPGREGWLGGDGDAASLGKVYGESTGGGRVTVWGAATGGNGGEGLRVAQATAARSVWSTRWAARPQVSST